MTEYDPRSIGDTVWLTSDRSQDPGGQKREEVVVESGNLGDG